MVSCSLPGPRQRPRTLPAPPRVAPTATLHSASAEFVGLRPRLFVQCLGTRTPRAAPSWAAPLSPHYSSAVFWAPQLRRAGQMRRPGGRAETCLRHTARSPRIPAPPRTGSRCSGHTSTLLQVVLAVWLLSEEAPGSCHTACLWEVKAVAEAGPHWRVRFRSRKCARHTHTHRHQVGAGAGMEHLQGHCGPEGWSFPGSPFGAGTQGRPGC